MKKLLLSVLLLISLCGCSSTSEISGIIESSDSPETTKVSKDNSNTDEYKVIEIDACDLSGDREANVKVDVGYGDREYWAYTNEYGQLIKVEADEVIIQDDYNEEVNSDGRYCNDEAKVPGTEASDLDEGHVIADSLGGVSNAYNITPQDSTMNRHGDQAYMEDIIRDAGGCTNFTAVITYPDTQTMIPSHYSYTFYINGEMINFEFDNVNPEDTIANYNQPSEEATQTTVDPDTAMVWISATGSKYHSINNCGTMNPDTAKQIELDDAISQGYEPCSKCN